MCSSCHVKPGVVGLEGVQQQSGTAKDLEFFVGAGFVEISENAATLLVDSCMIRLALFGQC